MTVVVSFLKEIDGEADKKLYQIGELKKIIPVFVLNPALMELFEKCNYARIFCKDFLNWRGDIFEIRILLVLDKCQAKLVNPFHEGKFKPKSIPMDLIHTQNFLFIAFAYFNKFALFRI